MHDFFVIKDGDIFYLDVVIFGNGNLWTANDPNSTTSTYNTTITFGPFLISDGNFDLIIQDFDDVNCQETLSIIPPEPCSSENCILNASFNTVICNDNNTPNDTTDDIFFVDITITGNGDQWREINLDSIGSYNATNTFGPFLIANGNIELIFQDIDDINCLDTILIPAPQPCSTEECTISADFANIFCSDNNTPNDTTDDVFFVDITISGNDDQWTEINLDSTGNYNTTNTFGPFLIANGNIELIFQDIDDINCLDTILIPVPQPCSTEECSISADFDNIFCSDNNTPNDTTDDIFFVDITISGNGDQWIEINLDSTGNYNTTKTFGPFLIANGNIELIFQDNDDINCLDTILIPAPEPCSTEECSILASFDNILCNDNNTPNDTTDDVFFVDITISGNGDQLIEINLDSTGNYNTTNTFGPFLIANGNIELIFQDIDELNCSDTINIIPPDACSNCNSIDTTFIQNPTCILLETGIDTSIFTSLNGCDSIVVQETIYEPQIFASSTVTICDESEFTNGEVIVDTIFSTNNCDTINTVTYILSSPLVIDEFYSICTGDSIVVNDIILNENNVTATDTILSIDGCDSVYLNLTIDIINSEYELVIEDENCFQENDGVISITPNPPNENILLQLNDNEIINTNLPYSIDNLAPNQYSLTITNSEGCSFSTNFEILPAEPIDIDLIFEELSTSENGIELEALTNLFGASYTWNLYEGDTTCVNCSSMISNPAEDFTFSVEIQSALGCIAADELEYFIQETQDDIEIANIFSPNDDGQNDIFQIFNPIPSILNFELSIYDRWGNLMHFENGSESVSWNGQFNNVVVSDGVYVYRLKMINLVTGEISFKFGDITVIK
mgnify:CR=1 FL=1